LRTVSRGHPDYNRARSRLVRNARIPDRCPGVIAYAQSKADVIDAIELASAMHASLAVRASGHHRNGTSIPEGGVTVDVSALSQIDIDAAAQRAVVGPGVTSRALAAALEPLALGFPVGHCATVAMGGYLLGGGFGWNSGIWRHACYSVESVDVVTADGTIATASDEENRELFWLTRGSGPMFPGVATSFTIKLHPLAGPMVATVSTFSLASANGLARWLDDLQEVIDPAVELNLSLSHGCGSAWGLDVGIVEISATAFPSSSGRADELLAPLRRPPSGCQPLAIREMHEQTWLELFDMLPAEGEPGVRYGSDVVSTRASLGSVFQLLASQLPHAPSRESFLMCSISPVVDATLEGAFSVNGSVMAVAYPIWRHAADDGTNRLWARQTIDLVADQSSFCYFVGESDLESDPRRLRQSFSEEKWSSICELRRRFDPDCRFWSASDLWRGPGPPTQYSRV
jgi:FAD/FMN-containing dehydrogenase